MSRIAAHSTKPAPVQYVKDRGTRQAIAELDGRVNDILDTLSDMFESDTDRGTVRLKASLILRDIGQDPTSTTTFGRRGELVRWDDRIFQKFDTTGEDNLWNELPVTGYVLTSRTLNAGTGLTGGGDLSADRTFAVDFSVVPRMYVQNATPATPSTFAIWLKTGVADGSELHFCMETGSASGSVWYWSKVRKANA